jgi:dephospho-CoA kinase
MHIIGIVGGVASGKSLATDYLRQLGAAVLDGDRAGHDVLREPEIIAAARARWGPAIIDPDGQIIRAELADIVFGATAEAEEELRFLEEMTHPRIRAKLQQQVQRLAEDGGFPAAVLDAPVLLKAGWDDFCDVIVFVDTPRELRLQCAASRGWTAADVDCREKAQLALEEKRARADRVIDNSGTPEQLREKIRNFWDSLFK